MSLNEIRDFPVQGFRNFIVTTSGVVDVQNLPTDILRIKVIGSGSTLIYIWDSQGRKTIQIEVTGLAPNQITSFRPGYDPAGNEFIYHTMMNNQFANGERISPFWNHEFSASVPFHKTSEWRTLLRASTNEPGPAEISHYSPFSSSTVFDQMLSYYQAPTYTVAVGDVNYNAGELSITGFPLRGISTEVHSANHQNQIQVFGGSSRPHLRTTDLFSDPSENFYGAAGTKEIFPNILIKSSLVYLDQPPTSLVPGLTFKNDFVADLGFQARPFTDTLTFEGEYGRSSDDDAARILAEYAPFWGRILLGYRQIGKNYITPSSFFLLKNFREASFITDVKPTKKLGFTLNYQLSELGADPILLSEKTTSHRLQLNSLYQANEEKSYLTGISVTRSSSISTPQYTERGDFTYQRFFKKSLNQFYAQVFGQHSKNYFISQSMDRIGGGTDIRYTRNFSKILQMYLQSTFQMNRIKSTFSSTTTPPKYIETIASIGPTLNYVRSNKTLSAGFYENFSFRGSFGEFSHLLQPFLSAYYNLSQALSLGTRMNFNFDLTGHTNYLSIAGELVYRFGSRVPDTLFSTFVPSAVITGAIFEDDNNDGAYQPSEKLVANVTSQLNDEDPIVSKNGGFTYKTDAGLNKISIQLPEGYQNYQFGTSNPATVDLFPRETKMLYFPVNQRIPLHGKVIVHQNPNDPITEKDAGLEGVKIEISGEGFATVSETSPAGIFNTYVTKPGKYLIKLRVVDLPRGYKYIGPPSMAIVAKEGEISKVPPFVVQARRFVIGRAFVDKNGNHTFDEDEPPAKGVKIRLGTFITVSEEDGSFSISSLPAGNYQIKVQPEKFQDYQLVLLNDRLTIPEAGTVELSIPYQK